MGGKKKKDRALLYPSKLIDSFKGDIDTECLAFQTIKFISRMMIAPRFSQTGFNRLFFVGDESLIELFLFYNPGYEK